MAKPNQEAKQAAKLLKKFAVRLSARRNVAAAGEPRLRSEGANVALEVVCILAEEAANLILDMIAQDEATAKAAK